MPLLILVSVPEEAGPHIAPLRPPHRLLPGEEVEASPVSLPYVGRRPATARPEEDAVIGAHVASHHVAVGTGVVAVLSGLGLPARSLPLRDTRRIPVDTRRRCPRSPVRAHASRRRPIRADACRRRRRDTRSRPTAAVAATASAGREDCVAWTGWRPLTSRRMSPLAHSSPPSRKPFSPRGGEANMRLRTVLVDSATSLPYSGERLARVLSYLLFCFSYWCVSEGLPPLYSFTLHYFESYPMFLHYREAVLPLDLSRHLHRALLMFRSGLVTRSSREKTHDFLQRCPRYLVSL